MRFCVFVFLRICAFVFLRICPHDRPGLYINLCNSIQVQPVLKRPRPSIVALPFYPSTNAPSMFFDSSALFEIDLEPFNAFNLYLHTPEGKVETVERKEAETMLMQFPIWAPFNSFGEKTILGPSVWQKFHLRPALEWWKGVWFLAQMLATYMGLWVVFLLTTRMRQLRLFVICTST